MASVRERAKSVASAVQLVIGRAVLSAVNDATKRQLVQFEALKGEIKDGVERMQQYGFSSVPLAGAQVLFVCLGGNRDHPVVVSVDDPRFRKSGMEPGEVAIYTDEGDYILLKRGRTIEIETVNLLVKCSESARFETPILEVTGEIIDHADTDGVSMNGMRNIYDTHTHPENNSGSTNSPNQPMGTP
ncbi:MAG: phage baseplate assembly protein V [Alphaproteobacteria bacterium]|nr:phage baseplate assembly protein V [Alphaproteobacteria bacterium]